MARRGRPEGLIRLFAFLDGSSPPNPEGPCDPRMEDPISKTAAAGLQVCVAGGKAGRKAGRLPEITLLDRGAFDDGTTADTIQ